MSEVQTRTAASRGRGSGRGGRGGFASRGGRAAGRTNGDKFDHKSEADDATAFEDQGELGELKKQYGSKTPLIKEMFPDWSEQDILYALHETDGDENLAVTRIAEGTISQWGEVTKKAPRSKAKESTTATSIIDSSNARPTRGGRNVAEAGRGRGSGRNTERGGRGGRGRSSHTAATNGTRHTKETAQPLSVPTEESNAWDTPKTDVKDAPAEDPWAPKETIEKPAPAPAPAPAASDAPKPAVAVPKTWASMLRQSTAPKPVPKPPKEEPAPKPAEPIEPLPPAVPAVEPTPEPEPEPQPEPVVEAPAEPAHEEPAPAEVPTVIEPEVALPPSKDQLTEANLEQVADESHPPATATVASTTADSWDPRLNAASATATPLSASQQQHQPARPAATTANSGFAASAIKATTERGSRTPSYQRRVLDQEEAVRMPGNREVDRAAVQFGTFSLNDEDDIDGDREEPETRTQPPADSPVAHPRTSLPPAPQQAPVPEAIGTQKPAPGLPPAAAVAPTGTYMAQTIDASNPANISDTGPAGAAPQLPASNQTPQPAPQPAQSYSRFGQTGPQEPSTFPQKTIDPFNQPNNPSATQNQFDSFPAQQSQQQNQQPGGAFTSAPSEYSSYYTADQQNRPPYNYYNQPYGQQGAQAHQDSLSSQQRSFSGYNASQADNLSQYPQSGGLQNQSRYGGVTNDAQNSGHTTPNPTAQSQQQASQASQPQSHGQQSYPYNSHPYYNNAYYSNYMNYGHYGQGGYAGAPYGKGGMYGHPGYGMSPQGPYDHTSSPAGFGQSSLHRADSGLGSGLGGDFGRAGSAQSANQPGLAGSGFGGMQDTFGRGSSSFQSPAGQGFSSTAQPNNSASADDLKPFGDSKPGAGPSPSLGGARPGSATNSTPSGQTGLPPPQSASQMGGYGGYPSHLQQQQGHGLHGSSGYNMGGATSGQHGSAPFGSYGQGGYGSGYYGSGGQQRGGWGGNYH